MCRRQLLPLAVALLVSLGVGATADLTDGLRFYAGFEEGAGPDYAFGNARVRDRAEAAETVPGRVGQAISLPDHDTETAVTYFGPGNFRRDVGTVAFWVAPAWDGRRDQPDQPRGRFMFSTGGFRIFWNRDHGSLTVMTGTGRPEGWRWDYSPTYSMEAWSAGSWHHIAVSWHGGEQRKRLYVDGELAGETETVWIASSDTAQDFQFGLAWQAPGEYDELALWGRMLSDDEVARLVDQPEEAAQVLRTVPMPVEPEWPVTVGLHWWTNRFPDAVVAPGEEIELRIPVTNPGGTPVAAELRFTLLDFHLNERAVGDLTLRLDAGEEAAADLRVSTDRLGIFKLRCDLTCGDFEGSRDVASFGVVPEPDVNEPVEDSYFGGHPEQTRNYIEQAGRYGLKWARCHDMIQSTRWYRVQPAEDDWAFHGDETITRCVDNGMHVLGVFLGTPRWAARVPEDYPQDARAHNYPPRDPAEYAEYVRRTVEHYRDRIRRWEVWNEPHHGGFWQGSAEEYVQLLRITYEVAKQADPGCIIIGGGGLSSHAREWAEQAMEAGLLEHCDWLSYHRYVSASEPPEAVLEDVEYFRGLLETHGHPRMPLICSEGGVVDTTFLDGLDFEELPPQRVRPPMNWRQGAIRLVQASALEMAAGIGQRFYYFQKVPPLARAYLDYSGLEITGAPRPKLMAWMAMERLLRGCPHAATVAREAWHAEVFAGPERAVAVCWTENGADVGLDVPDGWSVVDLMGNALPGEPTDVTLGDEPVYVVAPGLSGAALADALEG
ncbi:MAG: LamG-like jellyroll fold domain-containing protein [Armatimonadota bacterium]